MLKKESKAWQLAKRLAKRKYTMSAPVSLSPCGNVVTFQSLIRGNKWQHDQAEIEALLNFNSKKASA